MAHINQKRPNTRLQIIQVAAKLFIEEGYSTTTFSNIAKILDLSTGNITFYFKTKERLLAVLVNELFDFQRFLLEQAADEGKTSMLAYLLELVSIAGACDCDEAARDFFVAAYSSQLTLQLIQENDTAKTREIFGQYRPDWTDEKWRATENIVSGIEYATIMTRDGETPLDVQLELALQVILRLYGVPEELRETKIQKALSMDYRALGSRILREFKEYITQVNEENLKEAV